MKQRLEGKEKELLAHEKQLDEKEKVRLAAVFLVIFYCL